MADTKRSGITCDQGCGCPVPCPGGAACRCTSTGTQTAVGDDTSMEHNRCTCGEHCGCNPCTCNDRVTSVDDCRCGAGCTCVTCSG